MKLTELKNKMDEILKYQSDYDTAVDGIETYMDDCSIAESDIIDEKSKINYFY